MTHAAQIQCHDPSYAQVIGTARTIRNEALLDFATCEVDHIGSSIDKVVDIFAKFQARVKGESLKPDYEYAIIKNIVNVGGMYPFSPQDEFLLGTDSEDRTCLGLAKAGRLNTLQWASYQQKPLYGDDVEVEIYAVGLNFRVSTLFGCGISGLLFSHGSEALTIPSCDDSQFGNCLRLNRFYKTRELGPVIEFSSDIAEELPELLAIRQVVPFATIRCRVS